MAEGMESGLEAEDFVSKVREKFERAAEWEDDNRTRAIEDIKFARLAEQWPDGLKELRDKEKRPCLTLSEFNSFIRQVVNEARANRPSIQVVPADGNADKDTAEIISGLIRNIEVSSDADVAYDTAVDSAVSGGFGYFRINISETSDDNFDKDITIERIADALTVYGDPDSEAADSSDWNCAFIVKRMHEDDFEEQYGEDVDKVDWEGLKEVGAPWFDDEHVMVVEYWHREQVEREVVTLSDGTTVDTEEFQERQTEYQQAGIFPVGANKVKSFKVTQYIMTGKDVLETVEWPGKYIPIVPVYGDEVWVDGKRHLRSLIHDAKDAGREKNYWRSYAAEMVALAPKVPFIGRKGAFNADPEGWSAVNQATIPYLEYEGPERPSRDGFSAMPAAEMQQAMAAVDDLKAIIGIHSPSLGERGPAESGIAIRSLQRQADVGTFHFLDNLNRSIRHAGRILIDLIGKVYTTERMIRVLGADMAPQQAQLQPGAPPQEQQMAMMQQAQEMGQRFSRVYDLTAGKYDLVVKSGPAYGTQREYARQEMAQLIGQMGEMAAKLIGPLYLRNCDWPGAEEVADKLDALNEAEMGAQQPQGPDPQFMAQVQQMAQRLQQLEQENAALRGQYELKAEKNRIENFNAQTKRMEAAADAQEGMVNAQANLTKASAAFRQPTNQYGVGTS